MWEIFYLKVPLILHQRVHTGKKGRMNAMIQENLLSASMVSLHIKEFTLEKGLMSAVNMGNSFS